MNHEILRKLLIWCGFAHFALCFGSLLIPSMLRWRENLKDLQPLFRQMFWTYAGYILVINLAFGVISVFGSNEMLSRSFLAKSLTLFIGLYWLTRIAIQFFYFDKTYAPKGPIYKLGEIGLVTLFTVFAIVYCLAFIANLT